MKIRKKYLVGVAAGIVAVACSVAACEKKPVEETDPCKAPKEHYEELKNAYQAQKNLCLNTYLPQLLEYEWFKRAYNQHLVRGEVETIIYINSLLDPTKLSDTELELFKKLVESAQKTIDLEEDMKTYYDQNSDCILVAFNNTKSKTFA